jgi:hypothetical protein
MLKFCPIRGCYRLASSRIIINDIESICCKKHEKKTEEIIKLILKTKWDLHKIRGRKKHCQGFSLLV